MKVLLRAAGAIAVSAVLFSGTAYACLGELDCQKSVIGWTDGSGAFHSGTEITSFPATVKYRLDFTYSYPSDRCAVAWLKDSLYGTSFPPFSFPTDAQECYFPGGTCLWVYNPPSVSQFVEYELPIATFDACAKLGTTGPDGSVTVANLVTGGSYYNQLFDCSAQVICRPPPVGYGCTLTPGYWKTHSQYGPAPYDSTWTNIGENTPFFLSGQTYYQVMWTDSTSKYYILARAYIAALLNRFAGASVPEDVQEALDFAGSFFGSSTPGSTLSASLRAQVIGMAGILDNYNNGYIGPGHCAE